MEKVLTTGSLEEENACFRGGGGVSRNNCGAGFRPAFLDRETGRTELSRFAGGAPAPCHVIGGLPRDWVVARDRVGRVLAIKSSVIAGFLRDGRFYTREEVAQALAT